MNQLKQIITVPLSLALAMALFTACGASPYREPSSGVTVASQTQGNTNSGGNTGDNSGGNNGGGGGGSGDNSGGGTTDPGAGSLPPIATSFTVTGSGGSNPSYSFTVDTDNLLKVKITAGEATNVIPGSNFSASYSCVQYQVSALGQTVTTNTLGVNGGGQLCPNAPDSQTIDFSGRLTSGHQSVTITVKASGYDFYCQGCLSYPWLYNAYPYGYYSCNMYCPLHTVFKNHGVTGSMAVQVNGTSL